MGGRDGAQHAVETINQFTFVYISIQFLPFGAVTIQTVHHVVSLDRIVATPQILTKLSNIAKVAHTCMRILFYLTKRFCPRYNCASTI